MRNNIPESAIRDYLEMEENELQNHKVLEDWYTMTDDEKIEFIEDIWGQGTVGEIVVNNDTLTSAFLSHLQFNDKLWQQVVSALKERNED